MKRLALGSPLPGPQGFQTWASDALRQIERNSIDDIEQIVAEFAVTGTFTESRTLDADTATLSDVVNFVCTLVSDIKKGGQKRSYGS